MFVLYVECWDDLVTGREIERDTGIMDYIDPEPYIRDLITDRIMISSSSLVEGR